MPRLTYKQRLFVEAYLGPSNGNATDAARRAGYANPEIGRQLLRKIAIRAAIDARLDEAALKTSEILARLSDMATVDVADFIRISDDGRTFAIDLARAKRRGKTHLVKKLKMGEHGPEIQFHDAQAALEKLGRYRGIWQQNEDGNPEVAKVMAAICEVLSKGRETGEPQVPGE